MELIHSMVFNYNFIVTQYIKKLIYLYIVVHFSTEITNVIYKALLIKMIFILFDEFRTEITHAKVTVFCVRFICPVIGQSCIVKNDTENILQDVSSIHRITINLKSATNSLGS